MIMNWLVLLCAVPIVVESDWVLDWSDEFDGTAIDTTIWTAKRYDSNDDHHCYVDDDAYRYLDGDGHLVIKTQYVGEFTCWYKDRTKTFKSGAVTSKGKKESGPGKYEIIAKLPDVSYPRLHSAIWLQTEPYDCYQEVDIMEYWTGKTWPVTTPVTAAYHYNVQSRFKFGCGGGLSKANRYYYPREPDEPESMIWSDAYHNFTFVWDTQFLEFYIDGIEIERGRVTQTSPTPKNSTTGNTLPWQNSHLIINTAVCGKAYCDPEYGDLVNDSNLTAYFYIDSVRKYNWDTPSPTPVPVSPAHNEFIHQINPDNNIYSSNNFWNIIIIGCMTIIVLSVVICILLRAILSKQNKNYLSIPIENDHEPVSEIDSECNVALKDADQ